MDSEQLTNFNDRLNNWISSQGFWFQLRYSITGGSTKSAVIFQLLKGGTRVLIFLAVVVIATGVYLIRRPNTQQFNTAFKESVRSGLSASEVAMRGLANIQGQLNIGRIACEGGKGSFFSSMEAKNVQCQMGLLDGVVGQWDLGTVGISILNMDLRAGADDSESAQQLGKAIFFESEKVLLSSIDVSDATIQWGFAERTRGGIEHSALKIQRGKDFLKLVFRGGRFSQNWLSNLEIVNLTIICSPDGMTFEKAELRAGDGTVDFSGLVVTGGERPAVDGLIKIRKLNMNHVLPLIFDGFIEGSLSGDFTVSGSTNTSDGIGFDGKVTLDGVDTISLREKIHLLKALSVVDYVRNYHRLDFREGSFRLKTTGGELALDEISLVTSDRLSLEGRMAVRLPTPEEARASIAKTTLTGGTPLFSSEASRASAAGADNEGGDFSLRRAAMEAKKEKQQQEAAGGELSLFDRMGFAAEARQLEDDAATRVSRTLRYSGTLAITVPSDAFERAPKLSSQFPVDSNSGRIPILVPIEGTLYELTLKQAEEIYQLGTR